MATFTDDFNRANAPTLGANWSQFSNGFAVVDNTADADATLTCLAAWVTNCDSDDHYSQAKVVDVSASSIGVFVRAGTIGTSDTNTGSYYLARHNGTQWDIFRKTANSTTFTSLASAVAVLLAGQTVRLEITGSALRLLVDGSQVLTATDTNITNQRRVGIRSGGSATQKFDDFAGGDLSAGQSVAGNLATETDSAQAGALAVGLPGVLAAETVSANAGSAAMAVAGSLATTSETAMPGTAAVTVAGGLAVETDTGQPGTPAVTILGGLAAQVDAAFAGTVVVTVDGHLALESDLAMVGAASIAAPLAPAQLSTSTAAGPSLTTGQTGQNLATADGARPSLTTV